MTRIELNQKKNLLQHARIIVLHLTASAAHINVIMSSVSYLLSSFMKKLYSLQAKIWNIKRCLLVHTLSGHDGAVFSVDVTEDSSLVITASADKVSIKSFIFFFIIVHYIKIT